MAEKLALTEISAAVINDNFDDIETAVNAKAELNGDSTQKFNVADAVATTEAINKGQLDSTVTTINTSLTAETTRATAAESNLQAEIDLKANTTDVNAALAKKADLNGNSAELFNVADAIESKEAINKGQLDSSVANINTSLAAETTRATAAESNLQAEIDLKANTTDVNTALALKADKTYVDTSLALKANTADVNASLALKADSSSVYTKTEADTLLTGKLDKSDTTVTKQGNVFNGPGQLVQLDSNGKLPTIDGSQLKGINGGASSINDLGTISANFTLVENNITTGVVSGNCALTLPTIENTEKQITCIFDFTTTSASSPTITNTNLKWSDKNSGKAPSVYSTLSGVRNILTFKSFWVSGTLYWEAEYTTYGGIETTFTRPNLSANGTLGGSSFAVAASSVYSSGTDIYKAFDASTSTYTQSLNTLTAVDWIIYNPNALKVTSFSFTNKDVNGVPASGTVYGSNDNSVFTVLTSFTNSTTGVLTTWNADIPTANQGFYKYYKISVASIINTGYGVFAVEIGITATYIRT